MSAAPQPTVSPHTRPSRPGWQKLLDVVAVCAMLPTFLAGTARWWWIGDLASHFRMPYAIVLGVLVVAYSILRRWKWVPVIGLLLAANVRLLWPFYFAESLPGETDESLRVMVANVYLGNTNPAPVLDVVREEEPDVVVFIEVDDRWLADLGELHADYPHHTEAIRDVDYAGFDPFGMAIFSRVPLGESTVHRLGTARTPCIETTIEYAGRRWTIIGAHPYPPISPYCADARDTLLAELAQRIAQIDGPVVLLGDLNITRFSPHFADLLRRGGLTDSAVGFGYQPTWPTIPVIPIDHILVSPNIAVLSRHVGPSIASDHRPVIADVAARGSGGQRTASQYPTANSHSPSADL